MTRFVLSFTVLSLFTFACGTEAGWGDGTAAGLATDGTTSTTETGSVAGATYSGHDGGYILGVMVLDAKGRWTGEERLIFVPTEMWEAANGGKALPAKFKITYDASATTAPGGTHVDGTASSVTRA